MGKHTIVKKVLAYNPDTEEKLSDRRVFGSNPPSDLNFNSIRYKWAISLLENVQEANTWFTSEIPLKEDRHTYNKLTKYEKEMYDKSFSQITMMDTFQSANISENVLPYVSAPEIRACLIRQAWEEQLHSKSYAVIANTVSPDSDAIFHLYKTDEKLKAKNDKIVEIFNSVNENRTEENTYLSYVANQVLEGIFFQSAFACFFTLAASGKMLGTGEMIRLIARDEATHLVLFKSMIRSTQKERPYLKDDPEITQKVRDLVSAAVDLEIEWASYITSGKVLGLSPDIMSKYVRHLANVLMTGIRYDVLYPEITTNPMKHLDDFLPGKGKANFFECENTDYSSGSLSFEWAQY